MALSVEKNASGHTQPQRSTEDFLERIHPTLCRMAHARFKGSESQVSDVISCGWEIYSTARTDVTPANIAYYAVKTVASRRWMSTSKRCPSYAKRTEHQPTLFHFDFDDYCSSEHTNPARIATLRIDFTEWLDTLNDRQRDLVDLLASGESTADAAAKMGCSAANISQYRRRLADSWYTYQS